MSKEMTKEKLLGMIQTSYYELITYLESLSESQLTQPINGTWSVKDYIAHFAMWEAGMTNLLQKKPRHESMNISEEVWDTSDDDEINEAIKSFFASSSTTEAMNLFKQSHQELLSVLDTMSLEDLMLPYNHFDPVSQDTQPVVAFVNGNTFGHFSAHLNNLKTYFGDSS